MKKISSKNNITFGIILSYIQLGVGIVGTFFVTPILLRTIGDSNYGLLSFCTSITSWISILIPALSGSYLFFINKELKNDGTETKTPSLFFKVFFIAAGLIFLISLIIVAFCHFNNINLTNYSEQENSVIRWLLIISSLQISITMVFNVFNQHLVYKKSFVFIRSINIIVAILSHLINIVLALTTESIIAVAIAAACGALITGIANLLFCIFGKHLVISNVSFREHRSSLSQLFKYSSFIMLGAIANNLHSNIDKTILGIFTNSSNVTLYQLSIAFTLYLTQVAYVFTETLAPKFHEYYRLNKIDEVNDLFLRTAKIQSIILLFIVGGFLSVGYYFTDIWIGQSRIMVFYYTAVLMVTEIVPLCNTSGVECSKALNKHKFGTMVNIFSAVFNALLSITLVLLLPSDYAIWGCIVGTVIVRIVDAHIIMPIYYKKVCLLPIKNYYLNLLKICLFSVIGIIASCSIVYCCCDFIQTVFSKLIIGGIVYCCVFFLFLFLFERKTINSFFARFQKKNNIQI